LQVFHDGKDGKKKNKRGNQPFGGGGEKTRGRKKAGATKNMMSRVIKKITTQKGKKETRPKNKIQSKARVLGAEQMWSKVAANMETDRLKNNRPANGGKPMGCEKAWKGKRGLTTRSKKQRLKTPKILSKEKTIGIVPKRYHVARPPPLGHCRAKGNASESRQAHG